MSWDLIYLSIIYRLLTSWVHICISDLDAGLRTVPLRCLRPHVVDNRTLRLVLTSDLI